MEPFVFRVWHAYGPARLETTSAMIGAVTYADTMSSAFEGRSLVLNKQFFGGGFVRIPYRDITVVNPRKRIIILLILIYLDGLFAAAGVRISLKRQFAKHLIEELAELEDW
ncbi:hypothetical protein IC235_00565 [Hymenobacter sp. BT664]|uniref:Uncharacterized protein n=1 Tax=Hymenobacter montanus TaxID=2771359 RepID=A0A927B9T8_9BACT|nr:hypothetical protein [Hymenobacter montanus]MBD2766380.1 hypothetical protein [Hymenobacter montanus]